MKKLGLGLSLLLSCIALAQFVGYISDMGSHARHSHLAPMKQLWVKEVPPIRLDQFRLMDTKAHPFYPKDLQGRWHILLFGYTACPDVCPTTLRVLTQVLEVLAQAGNLPVPQALFISIDPERDTPSHLSRYLDKIHNKIIGLLGSEAELKHLLHTLRSDFKIEKHDGKVTVNHPTPLFLVNPQGECIGMFTHPQDAAKLKEALQAVLQEYAIPAEI